ncbi:tripartite tricarboxylate transporter substrate binding protein [Neoroseomonas soli]|uniref:Tripartite tricarboxylate transporter substrate binding protein n=1 Tax=Neoroseomonas soli TaxID=1081025 RepID=A0A9X9WW26_9PROT|nr:tripartite tricarboxylate transporter substrate binding protein [Neoroseomonas soli]MBR0671355.1 tripartite tricarboxylate transporter substrate binding protein [Neoroseomonas soli]
MHRRHLLALGATALAGAGTAQAQGTFPTRPIRIIYPYPPGGGGDIVARLVAEKMRSDLGQPVVVDNRPGAGGLIGAEAAARAPKDGYTVLVTAGGLAIAPSVYTRLPFDPVQDLVGVAQLALVPLLVVTRPESPLNSITDLIAQARREPDGVIFASFGNGTPPHLVGESIQQHAGVRMTHAPYRGGAQAMPDLLSGQLTVGIFDVVSMAPHVAAGRLKALAITGPRRAAALPEIPTLSEAGVPFDAVGWHAAFAPAGTPQPMVDRLNAAFVRAANLPEVRAAIVAGGSIPVEPPLTAPEWTAQFRRDVETWGAVARAANVTMD